MKNNKINFSILGILPNPRKAKLKIFHYNFLPENCKGLSGVITTLILIALVIAAVAIVWVTVTNLLTNKLDSAESCMNVFEKVEINERYTCYNNTSNNFQFSINIRNINLDELIVSVSGEGTTKSYTLTNEDQSISGLGPYPSGSGEVKLPEKNSGLTYVSSDFLNTPDLIKIAPVINGHQCGVSDSVVEIYSC